MIIVVIIDAIKVLIVILYRFIRGGRFSFVLFLILHKQILGQLAAWLSDRTTRLSVNGRRRYQTKRRQGSAQPDNLHPHGQAPLLQVQVCVCVFWVCTQVLKMRFASLVDVRVCFCDQFSAFNAPNSPGVRSNFV